MNGVTISPAAWCGTQCKQAGPPSGPWRLWVSLEPERLHGQTTMNSRESRLLSQQEQPEEFVSHLHSPELQEQSVQVKGDVLEQ